MSGELLSAGDRAFDALDDDEHLGIAGEHGVAGALSGTAPVGSTAGAPGGRAVRLVLQIEGDDLILVGVPRREHLPGGNPVVLGEAGLAVPESVHEAVVRLRVVIEDDHEAEATRLVDDRVHDLQRRLALQGSIASAGVVDTGRRVRAHGLQ